MTEIQREDFSFLSSDGVHQIHCFCIRPEHPTAVLQVEHGLSDHVERYLSFAEAMARAGYAVFADDHLGHGKSTNSADEQAWFAPKNGWNLICRDASHLTDLAKERYPDLPIVLMGHSMGSFLARTVILDHSDRYAALVLSGTAHKNGLVLGIGKALAKTVAFCHGNNQYRSKLINQIGLGVYNRPFAPNQTPFDWVSRDTETLSRYEADPCCYPMQTVGLFFDMFTGLNIIRQPKEIAKMRKDLPIYLMSGDRDPVGDMGKGVKTVEKLYRKAQLNDVTLRLYPDNRHELLNDFDREQVIADLLDWLADRLGKE